jgi:phosphatidylserine decarboxylase
MIKFAREGYPFILVFTVITILTLLFVKPFPIAVIPFLLTLFMFYFFRDPERTTVEGKDLFYSPADGRVILVRETTEDEILNGKALEVSIFMSVFNVHINRAPCEGVVKRVDHYPGRFMAAFRENASKANEHVTMLLQSGQEKVVVRQVAGLLARRIVCRVKPGDPLKQGQRFGMIKFSSRVDIFMPLTTQIKVKTGDNVKAGESVLGIIGENKTEDN